MFTKAWPGTSVQIAGYGKFIIMELGPSVYLDLKSENVVGILGIKVLLLVTVLMEVWESVLSKWCNKCEKLSFCPFVRSNA